MAISEISYALVVVRKMTPRVAKSKAGCWIAKPGIIGAMAKAAL
jgi:hypothetical protein